jgi:hypothetical protein
VLDFSYIYRDYFLNGRSDTINKYRDILKSRIIDKLTLEESGEAYSISRERARQIMAMLKGDFKKLFDGDVVKGRMVCLDSEYLARMQRFQRFLNTKYIHKRIDLVQYLNSNYSLALSGTMYQQYLSYLMFFMGFDEYVYTNSISKKDTIIYSSLTIKQINSHKRKVERTLQENILPMSIWDLAKKSGILSDIMENLLPLMDDVETVGGKYQLKSSSFVSFLDPVYRILKNHGKPMTHLEIMNALSIDTPTTTPSNFSGRIGNDSRFSILGSKATYGLAEWGVDTRTYKEVMKDVLTKAGKPITLKKFHELIVKEGHDIPYTTVVSYVGNYDSIFKRTSNNTVVLTSWKGHKKYKPSRRHHRLSQAEFNKEVVDYLSRRKGKKASTTQIRDHISKLYEGLSNQNTSLKIDKCPMLELNSIEGSTHIHQLKVDYKALASEEEFKHLKRHRRSKSNIKSEARKILEKKGEMFLKDLVNILISHTGATLTSIYGALNEGDFIKEETNTWPDSRKRIIKVK